jgi:hypothetical protein
MKIKSLTAALLALSLSACSSASKKVGSPETLSGREYLFPIGLYKHDVHLTIVGPPERKQHFNGIVRIQPEQIQLAALTPFGTTAFRILEDRKTGQVTADIYVPQMEPLREKLLQYYSNLHQLLTLKTGSSPHPGTRITLKDQSVLTLGTFDQNQIPETMKLDGPQFSIDIKVTSYEI